MLNIFGASTNKSLNTADLAHSSEKKYGGNGRLHRVMLSRDGLGFDPTGLERAAKAAQEIEKSTHVRASI